MWKDLRAEFDKLVTRWDDKFIHTHRRGGPRAPRVEQQDVDYERGFYEGAKWLLDNPEKYLQELARRAEKEE